jgi:hypothetical protein
LVYGAKYIHFGKGEKTVGEWAGVQVYIFTVYIYLSSHRYAGI